VINGNAAYLGRALSLAGMPPRFSSVIPDTLDAIHEALRLAVSRARVVILTGGLGPTPDDLTRDAMAGFFGLELREDPALLEHVRALFRLRGSEMPEASRNQGLFPVGATVIPNPHGTAAGIHVTHGDVQIFSLPGVPVEMRQMTDNYIVPLLRSLFPDALALNKTVRLAGIGESHLLEALGDQADIRSRVWLAYLPHHGLLDVRITALSSDLAEAEAQIAHAEGLLRERVGDHVYASGTATLPEVIGNILVNRAQTLATAESCTGGLITNMITDTPGASRWFHCGFVTYANQAKQHCLGVPPETLERCGAVSEDVVRLMAEGARTNAGTDWALAATGIAGPDGGSEQKPVGTVWIAVASPQRTTTRLLKLTGQRDIIKLRTAHALLYMVYRDLMDMPA
jgi:nicotinamide-nucleotide amidase